MLTTLLSETVFQGIRHETVPLSDPHIIETSGYYFGDSPEQLDSFVGTDFARSIGEEFISRLYAAQAFTELHERVHLLRLLIEDEPRTFAQVVEEANAPYADYRSMFSYSSQVLHTREWNGTFGNLQLGRFHWTDLHLIRYKEFPFTLLLSEGNAYTVQRNGNHYRAELRYDLTIDFDHIKAFYVTRQENELINHE